MAAITHQAMISALVAKYLNRCRGLTGRRRSDKPRKQKRSRRSTICGAGFDPEALALDIEVVKGCSG